MMVHVCQVHSLHRIEGLKRTYSLLNVLYDLRVISPGAFDYVWRNL